jgi:hypothetical protein
MSPISPSSLLLCGPNMGSRALCSNCREWLGGDLTSLGEEGLNGKSCCLWGLQKVLVLGIKVCWPGLMAHTCNPSTGEAETGGSQIQGQPELCELCE